MQCKECPVTLEVKLDILQIRISDAATSVSLLLAVFLPVLVVQ
jgi:hypothetical protein